MEKKFLSPKILNCSMISFILNFTENLLCYQKYANICTICCNYVNRTYSKHEYLYEISNM